MTTLNLSPFSRLVGLGFSKQVWGRYWDTGLVGVEPDGSDRVQAGLLYGYDCTLAVAGPYVYTISVVYPASIIYRYEINTGARLDVSTGLYYGNTVATDGQFVYAASGGFGVSDFFVAKFDLDLNLIWQHTYPGYDDGGLLTIEANPGGFVVHSNGKARFFDPDGVAIATVAGLSLATCETLGCATRDRFFIGDDADMITCYSGAGAAQYSFAVPAPAYLFRDDSAFAVNEHQVTIFYRPYDSGTGSYGTLHAIVIPRAVTRDASGNITSDVVDTAAAMNVELSTDGLVKAATTDANTFWHY